MFLLLYVCMCMQRLSKSFTVGRAQSGPLTALIGYLNVLLLLEYFEFSTFGLVWALPLPISLYVYVSVY